LVYFWYLFGTFLVYFLVYFQAALARRRQRGRRDLPSARSAHLRQRVRLRTHQDLHQDFEDGSRTQGFQMVSFQTKNPNLGKFWKAYGSMLLWSQISAILDNFWRKNWCFSQKPMLWSNFLHNLALFWVKNADFFAEFFGENIFKIITSVPGWKMLIYGH
jgi:hypothetical protein